MRLSAQQLQHVALSATASSSGVSSSPLARGVAGQRRSRRTLVRAWSAEEPLSSGAEVEGTPLARWLPPAAQRPSLDAPQAGAASTLDSMLLLLRDRNLDAMLEFFNDDLIDKLVAHKKHFGLTEDVQLQDFLKNNSKGLLDTYALRNLIMTAPHSVQVLSAMHIGPEKYLQRCAIVSPSGEECVLTFQLMLQEISECQYRGPPLLSKKWMLQGVTGECSSEELPSHPSPSFPPEAVVEAQLAALREGRVASVFAHASPENKAATGPVESFASMLQHNPAYSPLLHHAHVETLGRLQTSDTAYMQLVRITPGLGPRAGRAPAGSSGSSSRCQQQAQQQPLLFMWFVSRQGDSSTWSNCWMTDAVQLVNALPANFVQ